MKLKEFIGETIRLQQEAFIVDATINVVEMSSEHNVNRTFSLSFEHKSIKAEGSEIDISGMLNIRTLTEIDRVLLSMICVSD